MQRVKGKSMNTKILLGFLGGVLAASGVAYFLSHRQAEVRAPGVVTPAAVTSSAKPVSP